MTEKNYLDGVPLRLSSKFFPHPRLLFSEIDIHIPIDAIEDDYDFSVERSALAESSAWEEEKLRYAELEAKRLKEEAEEQRRILEAEETKRLVEQEEQRRVQEVEEQRRIQEVEEQRRLQEAEDLRQTQESETTVQQEQEEDQSPSGTSSIVSVSPEEATDPATNIDKESDSDNSEKHVSSSDKTATDCEPETEREAAAPPVPTTVSSYPQPNVPPMTNAFVPVISHLPANYNYNVHGYCNEQGVPVLAPRVYQHSNELPEAQVHHVTPNSSRANLNLSDFESDTANPFDNVELKSINDMEVLASVLKNNLSAAGASTGPSTSSSAIQSNPTNLNSTSLTYVNGIPSGYSSNGHSQSHAYYSQQYPHNSIYSSHSQPTWCLPYYPQQQQQQQGVSSGQTEGNSVRNPPAHAPAAVTSSNSFPHYYFPLLTSMASTRQTREQERAVSAYCAIPPYSSTQSMTANNSSQVSGPPMSYFPPTSSASQSPSQHNFHWNNSNAFSGGTGTSGGRNETNVSTGGNGNAAFSNPGDVPKSSEGTHRVVG